MKRILFYVMMFLQIAVIIMLWWQYTLIDKYGESIDLLIDNQYHTFDSIGYQRNVYVNYDIHTIDIKKWPKEVEKTYNERLYVLLEANTEGIYDVKKVSKHRLQAESDQVVFIGKYNYYDSISRENNVTYGLEKINDPNLYKQVNKNKPVVVTIKVAPWGQKKIVAIRNIDQ